MGNPHHSKPDLTDAEWRVMKQVWTFKRTNVREVYEALHETERWAYNTVRTLMERLRGKGYVKAKKVGNMYFYEPAQPRSQVAGRAVLDFADRVLDGAVGSVFSYLISEKHLSQEELDQLRQMIEEKGDGQ